MVEWIKQDTKEWVPFYFIKWHAYAYSYVLENIDIDTSLEERINKRLSLFTLYVFVFVFIYLFFWLALYKGEGEYWSRAGKKNQLFNLIFVNSQNFTICFTSGKIHNGNEKSIFEWDILFSTFLPWIQKYFSIHRLLLYAQLEN